MPMVERESEHQQITAALDAVLAGSSRVVLIEGPPGIGKSALMDVARAAAIERNIPVFRAAGADLTRDVSFGVVRQLFERAVVGSADGGQLTGAAAQVSALFGPQIVEDRGDESFAMLHGLYWLTADLADDGPIMLWVDDLHWCDQQSLRFLVYLAMRRDDLSVVLMLAGRPAQAGDDDYARMVAELIRVGEVDIVRPHALSVSGCAAVIQDRLGIAGEPAFAEACRGATGGNPLLLSQLCSVAAEKHLAPVARSVDELLRAGARSLTRRVQDRLHEIGPQAAALARAAAALADGPVPLAVTVAGLSLDDGLAAADALAASDIFASAESTRFVHPLVRSAVRDATPSPERERLHRRAAELLIAAGTDAEAAAAHLLHTAPDPATSSTPVASTLVAAADSAARRGAPDIACSYLRRALQEPQSAQARRDTVGRLGMLSMAVDLSQAETFLREYLSMVDEPAARASTAYRVGFVQVLQNRSAEAIALQRAVIDSLPTDAADHRQLLLAGIGTGITSDPAAAVHVQDYFDQIISERAEQGYGARSLDCIVAWFRYLLADGREDAVMRARRALTDPEFRTRDVGSLTWLDAVIALASGSLTEAGPIYDDAMTLAHERGSLATIGMLRIFRGQYWQWRGSLAEAAADGRDGVDLFELINQPSLLPTNAFWLVTLVEQGRIEEASQAFERLTRNGRQGAAAWFLLGWAKGRILAAQGKWADAADVLLDAGAQAAVYPWPRAYFIEWRLDAALALSRVGRHDQARALVAEELSIATRWGEARWLGAALRVSAQVNPNGPALDQLFTSVAELRNSGAELELAKSRVALGEALARSDRTIEAQQHLRDGLQGATQAGAPPLARHAVAQLRHLGIHAKRIALVGPGSLSPGERRVADLADAGATNREIAQTLFLTTKTVETHLTAIYRKLRISGRGELRAALRSPGGWSALSSPGDGERATGIEPA